MIKRYTTSEVVSLGQERYERDIRSKVEGTHRGKMLALDIETGTYALGDDSVTAIDLLEEQAPEAIVYVLRVGFPTAIRIGANRV